MSRAPDTGESTASIVARQQERAWRTILPKLRAGGILKRESRTRRSYVDGDGSLTDSFVRKKVAAGELIEHGLDKWRLRQPAAGEGE